MPFDRMRDRVLFPGDFSPLQHLEEPGLEPLNSVGPVSTAAPQCPGMQLSAVLASLSGSQFEMILGVGHTDVRYRP